MTIEMRILFAATRPCGIIVLIDTQSQQP